MFEFGSPAAGMTVLLGKLQTQTDAQGEFTFPVVTFGTYDITASDCY